MLTVIVRHQFRITYEIWIISGIAVVSVKMEVKKKDTLRIRKIIEIKINLESFSRIFF